MDILSRTATDAAVTNESCLLLQPLPISHDQLVSETKKAFRPILSALRRGWSPDDKRRFPPFFSRRDELGSTPEGLLCFRDRIVIPPPLRKLILDDLHSGHLGVDKNEVAGEVILLVA